MQKMISALTACQRDWLQHFQDCETSGKSIAEYAASQGFDAWAMYSGKKTLVEKGVLLRTHPVDTRTLTAILCSTASVE